MVVLDRQGLAFTANDGVPHRDPADHGLGEGDALVDVEFRGNGGGGDGGFHDVVPQKTVVRAARLAGERVSAETRVRGGGGGGAGGAGWVGRVGWASIRSEMTW